ncbi:MAG: DUF1761 domain-containing protein [Rhodobacterales bacterium]|nr:DUF1761 domain-containing protein [Rhodobacterales bacterium]
MQFLAVIVAAFATFAFGALWYAILAGPWMVASGVKRGPDGRPANGSSPTPYLISFVAIILVSGMMRHVFAMAGLDTLIEGVMGGLGVGLFFITPWIALNNGYTMRPFTLTVIDGGYATIGCMIMGIILTLF